MTNKKKLIILLILFFSQGIFSNIHHPLMPAYVSDLNLPDYMFGFFFAFMNLGMLVGAPIWGSLADGGKKKFSVVIGFLIYGIFQFLFSLGNIFGPWTLSLIRFFSGFGISASFTVIASEIILVTDKEKRARSIAYGAMFLAIGGGLGQFLGGFLYTNSFFIKYFRTNEIFYVLLIQGVLSIILSIYTLLLYKPVEIEKLEVKRKSFLSGFKEIKNISAHLLLFLLALTFITIAATNVDKYLDVYFINELGYGENTLGQFKMIVGFVGVIGSVLIVPLFMRLKKRLLTISIFQVLNSLIIFIIFSGTKYSFITYLYSFYLLYIIIKSVNEPLEREYISNYTTEDNIATIMGVRHSFYSLGTIVGPIFGAFIYDANPRTVFYSSSLIFVMAIILILLSYLLRKRKFRHTSNI